MIYSHSYEDPDTGELIDVMVDEDDGGAEDYRNAGPRDHRGGGHGGARPSHHSRPRPQGHQHGTRPRPRPRPQQTLVVRDQGAARPLRPQPAQGMGYDAGDYFAINKSAIAEIVPALGQIWASFLGRPDAPLAVGNDIVDRDNASAHREALAMHQQNQTRILALTDLAARAAKLFL